MWGMSMGLDPMDEKLRQRNDETKGGRKTVRRLAGATVRMWVRQVRYGENFLVPLDTILPWEYNIQHEN